MNTAWQNLFRQRHGLATLLIGLFFVVIVVYQMQISLQAAKDKARNDVQNLVLVLESKLASDFAAAERNVSNMIADMDPAAMYREAVWHHGQAINHGLEFQVQDISSASALRYFDARGDSLYSSVASDPATNIADRSYFQQARDNPASPLIYSEVVIGRSTGHAALLMVKAVRDRQGAFLGVAMAAIDLTKVYEQFKSLELGKAGAIALRRLDNGALVLRYPGVIEVDNRPAMDFPLRLAILKNGPNGAMEVTSPVDGTRRISGYRRIGQFPFFVGVGIADKDALAEWRVNSTFLLIGALAFLALLAFAESHRSRSLARLEESEQRFRSLILHNNDVILQIDPASGRILDANAAACRFYGWSHDDLCARTIQSINTLPPDQVATGRAEAAREERNDFVFPHRLANGAIRMVEVHSTAISNGERPLLVSIIHDITERIESARQLEGLMQEQKAILESRIVGIVKLQNRKFVWSNDCFAEMLGYTREALIGQPTRLAFASDEAHAEFALIAYPFLQRNEIFRGETQYQRKDGTLVWYEISGGLIAGGHGESIWAMVDISPRKSLEAELEEHRQHLETLVEARTADLSVALVAAEAASRAKSTFLAHMSHELRTPMNGIMGMNAMALRHATDPRQINQLTKLAGSARHLLAIINDILDLSKIEAGELSLEARDFHLGEVLEHLKALTGLTARDKGLTLSLDMGLADLDLHGDSLRLSQILLNLTGNAIKFTTRGVVSLAVRLVEDLPQQVLLRFEVADTGPGISAVDQQRLFHAFARADESMTRKYGGTGLGLAISKKLVLAMGGEIGVDSELGVGSLFWFTARLARAPRRQETPAPAPSAENLLKSRYAGARILLAEDESINQEIARDLLEDIGLRVDVAGDGAAALVMTKVTDYALILMDLQMPKLSGLEVTRAIRDIPGREHTPIVALTASVHPDDKVDCVALGMCAFVTKPIEPEILFASVLQGLRGH